MNLKEFLGPRDYKTRLYRILKRKSVNTSPAELAVIDPTFSYLADFWLFPASQFSATESEHEDICQFAERCLLPYLPEAFDIDLCLRLVGLEQHIFSTEGQHLELVGRARRLESLFSPRLTIQLARLLCRAVFYKCWPGVSGHSTLFREGPDQGIKSTASLIERHDVKSALDEILNCIPYWASQIRVIHEDFSKNKNTITRYSTSLREEEDKFYSELANALKRIAKEEEHDKHLERLLIEQCILLVGKLGAEQVIQLLSSIGEAGSPALIRVYYFSKSMAGRDYHYGNFRDGRSIKYSEKYLSPGINDAPLAALSSLVSLGATGPYFALALLESGEAPPEFVEAYQKIPIKDRVWAVQALNQRYSADMLSQPKEALGPGEWKAVMKYLTEEERTKLWIPNLAYKIFFETPCVDSWVHECYGEHFSEVEVQYAQRIFAARFRGLLLSEESAKNIESRLRQNGLWNDERASVLQHWVKFGIDAPPFSNPMPVRSFS